MSNVTVSNKAPASIERSARIRGRTLRWTWSEGPTKGSTHEHVFNDDGTVQWTCLGGPGKGHSVREKSYAAVAVTDDVHVVSYLGSTGWTLTVTLNFRDRSMVGFASNGKEWSPCRGTFEEVGSGHQSSAERTPHLVPRVESGRPMRIAGLQRHFTEKARADIPAQWQRLISQLGQIRGRIGTATYGLCFGATNGFDYLSGVEVADTSGLPSDFSQVNMPAQRYAVFPHRDHVSKLHETIEVIFDRWLPASGHMIASPREGMPTFFERYGEAFNPETGTGGIEVWIPIES